MVCLKCKQDINEECESCPYCGLNPRKELKRIKYTVIITIICLVFFIVIKPALPTQTKGGDWAATQVDKSARKIDLQRIANTAQTLTQSNRTRQTQANPAPAGTQQNQGSGQATVRLSNTSWQFLLVSTLPFGSGAGLSTTREEIIDFGNGNYTHQIRNGTNERGLYKISGNLITFNSSTGNIKTGIVEGDKLTIDSTVFTRIK